MMNELRKKIGNGIIPFICLGLLLSSVAAFACPGDGKGNGDGKMFKCKVNDVTVVAHSEEDCQKLGGEVVQVIDKKGKKKCKNCHIVKEKKAAN